MARRTLRIAIWVVGVTALSAATFGYYVTYIHREQLKDWRLIHVEFEDVGGLEVGDPVMVKGARSGRVGEIRLFEDRQLVTLEVEPDLPLYAEGIRVQVVATSALGYVGVDLDPGDPDARPLPPEVRLKGTIRSGFGGKGAPGDELRRSLREDLAEFARLTDEIRQPGSGTIGRLLFDPDRAVTLDEGLAQLERTWRSVDDTLAEVERGEQGSALLEPAALDALSQTVGALDETLSTLRGDLRRVVRGEGTAGRLLADGSGAADVRDTLQQQATAFRQARQGENTLGRLLDRDERTVSDTIDRLERTTSAAVRGEGLLGALHTESAGDSAREFLSGIEGTTGRIRTSPFIRDADARASFQDAAGRLDDVMNDLRRGLRGLRGSLPDKTFSGVLFGVF